MSSTNRGSIRNEFGYYYTPIKTIQDFWKKFCEVENIKLEDFHTILDPAAGGDELRPCAYPEALMTFDSEKDRQIKEERFFTIDIRTNSKATYKRDYFSQSFGYFPLIITNPDFILFEQYVKKGLTELVPYGYLILLLRLNAIGAQERKHFWQNYTPKSIYAHSERPNFMKGQKVWNEKKQKMVHAGTDSCEYAHFVWRANQAVKETKFYWV